RAGCLCLVQQQAPAAPFTTAAIEDAVVGSGIRARGAEEADTQRADPSTREVHTEHVERVIEPELALETDREGAAGAGEQADEQRADRADEAGTRGDRHEAGNCTRRRTQGG